MSKQWPARIALAAIMATTLSVTAPAYAQEPPVGTANPLNTLTIGPMDAAYPPFQTNRYKFTAKAGALQLKTVAAIGAVTHVLITTAGTDTSAPPAAGFVASKLLNADDQEAVVAIPADGDYLLVMTRVTADGKHGHGEPLTLTGPGLKADSLYVPPIEVRGLVNGQTVIAPLTIQVGIMDGAPAKDLKVMVDAAQSTQASVAPDGPAHPYTIDPAALGDGLHFLMAAANAPQGPNAGVAVRMFLVDRVDSFTDVPRGYWGRPAIELLADQGVLKGRGGGKFAPAAPVTREEFAKMVAMTNGLKAPTAGGAEFADIPADAWSREHVQALAIAKLIKGERVDGVDYFRPKRLITRAEAATIIGRSHGITENTVIAGDTPFTDFADVPDWARAAVKALARTHTLTGFEDGTFRPNEPVTRAQAAKILAGGI